MTWRLDLCLSLLNYILVANTESIAWKIIFAVTALFWSASAVMGFSGDLKFRRRLRDKLKADR